MQKFLLETSSPLKQASEILDVFNKKTTENEIHTFFSPDFKRAISCWWEGIEFFARPEEITTNETTTPTPKHNSEISLERQVWWSLNEQGKHGQARLSRLLLLSENANLTAGYPLDHHQQLINKWTKAIQSNRQDLDLKTPKDIALLLRSRKGEGNVYLHKHGIVHFSPGLGTLIIPLRDLVGEHEGGRGWAIKKTDFVSFLRTLDSFQEPSFNTKTHNLTIAGKQLQTHDANPVALPPHILDTPTIGSVTREQIGSLDLVVKNRTSNQTFNSAYWFTPDSIFLTDRIFARRIQNNDGCFIKENGYFANPGARWSSGTEIAIQDEGSVSIETSIDGLPNIKIIDNNDMQPSRDTNFGQRLERLFEYLGEPLDSVLSLGRGHGPQGFVPILRDGKPFKMINPVYGRDLFADPVILGGGNWYLKNGGVLTHVFNGVETMVILTRD